MRANANGLMRSRNWVMLVVAVACFLGSSDAGERAKPDVPSSKKKASSMLIRAYAFDRGNVQTIASGSYADAEPVVLNGGKVPNVMEYDIDFPVSADYTLSGRYAALESRPVDIYVDGKKIAQGFKSVTGSWQSSSAIWEKACDVSLAKGKHTLKLACPGPCIPHIVAMRLDSSVPFPAGWKLRRPGAKRLTDRPLGQLSGYDNGKDGYEAFVREDGFVNVPDQYNPIIRFERHPAPAPNAHRILEYTLMGRDKYDVKATISEDPRENADGWAATLSVQVRDGRTESAVLPLSEKQLRKMLRHALTLIADFRETSGPDVLETERRHAQRLLSELDALMSVEQDNQDKWRRFYELYLQGYQLKNRVALSNPLLDFSKLVFVKRQTYDTSHIYTTYFDGSHRFGGNLYVMSKLRPDAEPRQLAKELSHDGIYRDPDVSWDGKRVLFSYKPPKQSSPYQIFEIGVDGGGLRKLTDSNYDDVDPVYLPDGRIMFVSTRPQRVVLCHNAFTVSVLHTMNADGSNIHCVSVNTSNEFTPSVAGDGNVLYTRWEYVDKNLGNNQALWRARPDGTFAEHIAGAHWGPVTFWEPRQVPGSQLIVCTLAPHMPIAVGPIALVDPHDVCRCPAKFTNLTPELPPPHHFSWHRSDVGYYCNPYPLSEKYFLVSYNYNADPREAKGYGLYLLDRWGNRDLLYRDPDVSCFEAMPAVARSRPPALPVAERQAENTGTFIVLDVYQGLKGVERGEVKYLRVINEVAKPVSAQCPGYRLQYPVVSQHGNFAVKRLLGTVPVEQDGSVHFQAPAGKALYFAALDENYMEIQRMRSFVHLEPGQTITCIGCHENRRTAPQNTLVAALGRPASQITPPPGGIRAPDFYLDVQPVLDRYCVECHSGKRIDGGVDLAADYTNLFNVAYETLTAGYVNYVSLYSSATLALRPPKYYGSHASKLIDVLRGDHKQYVELPPDAFRKLVTWIDCNAPYYSTYRYTRPGTTGGRELVAGEVQRALEGVFSKRCASCHKGDTNRVRQVRFPHIERSPTLLAPLAKTSGGTGRCGQAVFADRNDPDYQAMQKALALLHEQIQKNPRVDMLIARPSIVDKNAPYRFR